MNKLSFGSMGSDVRTLQLNLKLLGYGNFIGTGYFGATTHKSVRDFQVNNKLPATGVWGVQEVACMINELSAINRRKIYAAALSCLGTDASPNDLAPDELGCADTVSSILQKALGKAMAIDYTISTAQLYRELSTSKAYIRVSDPKEGDILVSPTGYGNGNLSNGHTGIWGKDGLIMSNSSATGTFLQNYNSETWKNRYVLTGGFPMFTFRKL